MLALLCAMFMIPATPGCCYEVRGNGEMFPLNGPSWSLFFEYIGNVLYALIIRRLSKVALTLLVIVLGILHTGFAVLDISGYGSIGVGWTIDTMNFFGGLLRMLFPFTAGMLVARNFRAINVRGAFWLSSAVLLALFCVPYLPHSASSLSFRFLYGSAHQDAHLMECLTRFAVFSVIYHIRYMSSTILLCIFFIRG